MRTIVFNNDDPNNIVSTEHVSYFTRVDIDDKVALYEVVITNYKHPDAPEHAVWPVLEERLISSHARGSYEAGVLVLLEANNKAVRRQFRDIANKTLADNRKS